MASGMAVVTGAPWTDDRGGFDAVVEVAKARFLRGESVGIFDSQLCHAEAHGGN